jgi:hypothetical protein
MLEIQIAQLHLVEVFRVEFNNVYEMVNGIYGEVDLWSYINVAL